MTDERLGERLWAAIARLPDGEAGIVFRHYATPEYERAALASRIAQACRERRIALAIAGDVALARALGADLVHNPRETAAMPFSVSIHNLDEAREARRRGAALVFVSSVNPTRSHPGKPALGPELGAGLARAAGVSAIALGGMTEAAFSALPDGAFHGWAGIDAWISAGDG